MQQYFVNDKLKVNDLYKFDKSDEHHIKNVLRMKENQIIRVVDFDKKLFLASILYKDDGTYAHINKDLALNSEMNVKVTIVQGLIKGDRWDYFLQKATELGVFRIVPFSSNRCVVKVNDKLDNKVLRWNKITQEASEQSKRLIIPNVENPIKIADIVNYKSDINLVAFEDDAYDGLKLKQCIEANKSVTIVIGPEGGFDIKEIEYLLENDFKTCSLGPRILRAETASCYALSAISSIVE